MRQQLMEDWALTELFRERYRMEIADGDQVPLPPPRELPAGAVPGGDVREGRRDRACCGVAAPEA